MYCIIFENTVLFNMILECKMNSIRGYNEQVGFLQERNPIRGMAKCWNSWNSYNKQDCSDYIQFILLFAILQQGTELIISSIESNGDPHGL